MIWMRQKESGGRNSDNTLILELLGWEPTLPLAVGMKETYDWIRTQMISGGIK